MTDNEAIPEDPQNIHLLKTEKREENMQNQSRFELWRGTPLNIDCSPPVKLAFPGGAGPCQKLNESGDSTCVTLATKSPRKVLRSSPWARHFFEKFVFNDIGPIPRSSLQT